MSRRLVKVGSSPVIGFPCSTEVRRGPREASATVSVARRDQGMAPSSWASVRMVFIKSDSASRESWVIQERQCSLCRMGKGLLREHRPRGYSC